MAKDSQLYCSEIFFSSFEIPFFLPDKHISPSHGLRTAIFCKGGYSIILHSPGEKTPSLWFITYAKQWMLFFLYYIMYLSFNPFFTEYMLYSAVLQADYCKRRIKIIVYEWKFLVWKSVVLWVAQFLVESVCISMIYFRIELPV